MKKEIIVELHSRFEQLVQMDTESHVEFWLARDLQKALGYNEWRNFQNVISKAKTSCKSSGYEVSDHFVDVNKMIDLAKGAKREIEDIAKKDRQIRYLRNI